MSESPLVPHSHGSQAPLHHPPAGSTILCSVSVRHRQLVWLRDVQGHWALAARPRPQWGPSHERGTLALFLEPGSYGPGTHRVGTYRD
jgi:hypothetical protein